MRMLNVGCAVREMSRNRAKQQSDEMKRCNRRIATNCNGRFEHSPKGDGGRTVPELGSANAIAAVTEFYLAGLTSVFRGCG